MKTYNENKPIRLVIDNTQAPSYNIAKFLNNRLKNYINLPDTYITKNSQEIVQELHNTQIRANHKIITLDINDLYVNLPRKGIIQVTRFWLDRNNINNTITEQIIHLLKVILGQNYFQYNNQFFQQDKGITMGSPISSTLAEVYLQFIEETRIKQLMENQEIIYYKRYVDDILIIFDHNKINKTTIIDCVNKLDEHLEFKASQEIDRLTNYMDLTIYRNTNTIDLSIYRKPTHADITIQSSSNHPLDYKLAAFSYYINRMITLPITKQALEQEWDKILNSPKQSLS